MVSIDVLINNAGYGAFKGFEEFSAQEIADMFQVNTLASIHFACLIGQKMAEQGQGHLINIVSMAGLIASAKSSIYSATKFALIGFSNALRLELADKGVYVTTVNPGPIATKFLTKLTRLDIIWKALVNLLSNQIKWLSVWFLLSGKINEN